MANEVIGEVEITLGGRKHTLKPSFKALAEIKTYAGVGLNGVAKKIGEGNFGPEDVATLIYIGLLGSGDKSLDYEEVGKLIIQDGYTTFLPALVTFVRAATNPNNEVVDLKKEKKKENV